MAAELLVQLEQECSTSNWTSLRSIASRAEDHQPAELRDIVLLAPPGAEIPPQMNQIASEVGTHARLLFDMQRLRGKIALEEGAIQRHELTADLRHIQLVDYESWHALALNQAGGVCGCARFRLHSGKVRYSDLGAAHSALAKSEMYGRLVAEAIEGEIAQARYRGIGFAEVGGWAVDHTSRCSVKGGAITLALVIFALAARLGHCIGITTATRKSRSADILRRLGGESLQVKSQNLPPYFDPQYGCEMELLRFDSRAPADRYQSKLQYIEKHLSAVRVAVAEPGSGAYAERGISHAA